MRSRLEQLGLAKKIEKLRKEQYMSWVDIGSELKVATSYAHRIFKRYKNGELSDTLLEAMTAEINAQTDGDQEAVEKVEVLLGEKTRKIRILVYPGNAKTKIGDESKGFEVVVYEPEADDSGEYKKELDRRIKNKMIWKPVFDANSFDDGDV